MFHDRLCQEHLFVFVRGERAMNIELLYRRITPELNRIAKKYRSYNSSLDEGDLFQEMCIHLLIRYKSGVPDHLNHSYVIKGCEFHLLNFLRKKKEKLNSQSLEDIQNSEGNRLNNQLSDTRESLNEMIAVKIVIERIKNELPSVREKKLFVFLLKGYTIREIGKKLEISHVMVHKIKKKMTTKYKLYKKLKLSSWNN